MKAPYSLSIIYLHGMKRKALSSLLAFSLIAPAAPLAQAANHPYSQMATINNIEFTANLDWDPDSPPSVTGRTLDSGEATTTKVLDKAYIKSVLDSMAQTMFTMTEGKHRVSKIYIYKNSRYGNNVDIRLLKGQDTSSANAGGFGRNGLTSFNYAIQGPNLLETEKGYGQVIAHEMGHYFYGLYDEYAQGNGTELVQPRATDNAKNTLMHDQYRFATLSTPEDYAEDGKRNTAQARVYGDNNNGMRGGSAWEVLTRDRSQDPAQAKTVDGAMNRMVFEAFKGLSFPTQASLTKPTLPANMLPEIIYLDPQGPKNVIFVDRSVNAETFAKVIESAKGVVGKAPAEGETAVFFSPLVNNNYQATGFVRNDEAGKARLIQALDGIKADPATAFSSEGLEFARQELKTARGGNLNEPATITLLAGGSTEVSADEGNKARTDKVAYNVVRFPDGGNSGQQAASGMATNNAGTVGRAMNSLTQLAMNSGGAFNNARTSAEATKEANRELMESIMNVALVSADGVEKLSAQEKLTSPFRIAKSKIDGTVYVSWYFDPADSSRLAFSVKSPTGTTYSSAAMPANSPVQFVLDATDGFAEFVIPADLANREGEWVSEVIASAATSDVVELEVLSESVTGIEVEFMGGLNGVAPRLLATFLGDGAAIAGASIIANVFNADTGALVLENLALKDDGLGLDQRANDGQYVADLTGRLPAGNYVTEIIAKTDDKSTFSTNAIFARGTGGPAQLTGLVSRSEYTEFSVTQAMSTTPVASNGSGGGGCAAMAGGNDVSLLILLLAGLMGLGLRARRVWRKQ